MIELRTETLTTPRDVAGFFGGDLVTIEPATLLALDRSFDRLAARAGGEPLYGVNTGFGPMVRITIAASDLTTMQYNVIRSHAVGLGPAIEPDLGRAVMFARLRSLVANRSAVRASLVEMFATLLNAGIAPAIPRKGGVGASGDLIQLAHLATLLLGEGRAFADGHAIEASEALRRAGLQPWQPRVREGLAILNGTSGMTGLALAACFRARRMVEWAIGFSGMLAEIARCSDEFISGFLNEAKRHPGQQDVAGRMRQFLTGSRALAHGAAARDASRPLQEPYSIRCVPQILGPIVESLNFVEAIVYRELNSASDNPIFDSATDTVYHGGNFHGEYIAFALDTLKISMVKCSMLMERQLNYLLNDSINGCLPPFLNAGRLGIDLGLQGAQFTATSSAAHNQTLAFPMSVHSISSNKDNQDVVSMGFNAGLLTLEVIDNAFDIAGILAVAISQAIALAGVADAIGTRSSQVVAAIRGVAPVIHDDRDIAPAIAAAARLVRDAGP